jgi:AraC family 4-hydroxyphenylacetate 3-monooxygenase operon regulatory protein
MKTTSLQFKIPMGSIAAIITINSGFMDYSLQIPNYRHDHPCYEIQFIIKGDNWIKTSTDTISVNEGHILIVPPKIAHAIIPVLNNNESKRASFSLELYACESDPDYTDNSGEYIRSIFSKLNKICILKDTFDGCHIVENMQIEITMKKLGYESKLKAEFMLMIVEMCRCLSESIFVGSSEVRSSCESQILIIEEHLRNCINKNFNEDTLAKEMHVSKRQLERLVNKLYGKSFRMLLLDTRMNMANYYIEETKISFSQIAESIGYGSIDAFQHAYKKYFSFTPGQYRERIRAFDILRQPDNQLDR